MYRLTPDFAIRSEFGEAFAPDYDVSPEFEDVIVDGYRAMTYTSFKETQRRSPTIATRSRWTRGSPQPRCR